MRFTRGLSAFFGLIALLSAAPCAADGTPAPAPEAAAANAVTSYPASFFAGKDIDTAFDMVGRLPGFVFDDGVLIRGFAGAAGDVLIDGQRPSSKTDDLQGILTRIPASRVERIDLIRGGAPGVDMQGKTEVANVVLKKGGGFRGDWQVALTRTEDGRAQPEVHLDAAWRWRAVDLSAGFVAIDRRILSQGSGERTIRDANGGLLSRAFMHNFGESWSYTGTLDAEAPAAGGTLKANLLVSTFSERVDQSGGFAPPYVTPDADFAGLQVEHDLWPQTTGEFGLHWSRDLKPGLSLELIGLQNLYWQDARSTFDTPGDSELFDARDQGGESIVRAIVHRKRSETLTFEAGGEYAYNWVRTKTGFSDNGVPIAIPAANVRVDEKRGEVFADATWRAMAKLTLEAGVRVEASTIGSAGDVELRNSFVFAKPRAVLTWAAGPSDQLRLRVEREVGQIDFSNFVGNASLNGAGVHAGNPDLAPQQDWAYEATWEHSFWKSGSLVLTARRLSIQDAVDRVPIFGPSGAFDAPGNIGAAAETDLVATVSLPLDRFFVPHGTLRATGTWRWSAVHDPTTGERRPLSGSSHPRDAEAHFTQDLPGRNLTWGIDSFIDARERDYSFNEIDTYHSETQYWVFIEYKPRSDLSVRLEGDNVTRASYLPTRRVFSGARTPGAIPEYIDVNRRQFGTKWWIQVRKTFGAS